MIDAVDAHEGPFVMATVVDVVGSAYRRPGARMLVLPDGSHIGTISGGCLEKDLCRRAHSITENGPTLIGIDTRSEITDLAPKYNLGCSGLIYVLMERVTGGTHCPLATWRRVFAQRQSEIIGTVYQSEISGIQIGDRWTQYELLNRSNLFQSIIDEIDVTGNRICCQLTDGDRNARILIERIDPPMPFWIFGAGDDAMPLAKIAAEMGWQVTIVDSRAEKLTRTNFPTVHHMICTAAAQAHENLTIDRQTVGILMTHSFSSDVVLLPWLLQSSARYVGLLGPKARTGKIIKRLYADGSVPSLELLDKLHTPVGLDIGAANPAEISVSIVADVIAQLRNRSGGSLHDSSEPIHQPVMHRLIDLRQAIIVSTPS